MLRFALVLLLPAVVYAQKDVASCKAVFDASMKRANTPYHGYIGPAPLQEMISTGGQNYVLMNGKWKKSPMDVATMTQQEQENIKTATEISCRRVRDESVNGESAVVYSSHMVNEGVASDGYVWVGRSSGLVLRTESDVDLAGEKKHFSTRYEYTNVHAPTVAQ